MSRPKKQTAEELELLLEERRKEEQEEQERQIQRIKNEEEKQQLPPLPPPPIGIKENKVNDMLVFVVKKMSWVVVLNMVMVFMLLGLYLLWFLP